MSKIDDFNIAKEKSERISNFANRSLERHPKSGNGFLVDKFGAKVQFCDTHHGDYGSSSSYPWPDEIRDEVIKQIHIEIRQIVKRASDRVASETEEIRLEAIDEAKAVLLEIGK